MKSREIASKIIDLAAQNVEIKDYDIEIHEATILEARINLEKGFIDVFKNDRTDKTAFAWIINQKRKYGADNTGGWHKHPLEDPEKHRSTEPIQIQEFVKYCIDNLDSV